MCRQGVRHLERDELEAVDVDEAAVRDLQVRDHREREEREREERRRSGPAQCVRRVVAGAALRDHLGERRIRQQAGNGKRALGEHAQAVDRDDPSAELDESLDRKGHVPVGHADDDEVVRVVGHARGERACLQSRACDEPEPDSPGREVALDHGDLREIPGRARDRLAALDGRLTRQRLGHDLILDQADRTHGAAGPRDREVLRRERRDTHRLTHPVGDLDAWHVLDPGPTLQHRRRSEAHEVGQDEEIRDVAGSERPVSREAVPERGVMRGHQQCILGSDTRRDGLANHPVHVSRVRDVLRIAIVRAERDAPRPELLDERQERSQVARHRRLADQEPHARAQPFAPLLDRQRLVVGVDAGSRIRLELAPQQSGRMPVHVLRSVERELRELVRRAGDDAGEVHHLREPQHSASAHQRLEVARRERSARRLERRRRNARGRHEVDVELEVRARVEQPVHTVDSEDVRDLVRVGDDGRRPERQHQARELVDHELHRLEVHVRVDESGYDVAPGRVERLPALVRSRSRRSRRRRSRRPRRATRA